MNKAISPIYTSHGQSFISNDIDINEELKLIKSFNFDQIKSNLKTEDLDISKKIFDSIKNDTNLPFPISNHEKFRIKQISDGSNIFKYLIFRNKLYLSSKNKFAFEYPPYLLVELVSACNLKCPMCFQSDKSFAKKPFMGVMNFDLVKKIINEANNGNIGAITFASRGEPMMHPKFIDIVEFCSDKENIFEIKLNTNGTYLDEKKGRAIFENKVDVVVISADHYEKKLYEKYRLGAKFEDVVERVKNFYELRKDYPNSKTEIRVSGVNVAGNIDKDKFKKFWMQFSDSVSIGDPIERWDTYNNTKSDINSSCPKLWDRMYVWFDGKVNPCDEDYKSYLSYGKLGEKTIKEIWNNQKIKNLRESHSNKKRIDIVPCDRCGVNA